MTDAALADLAELLRQVLRDELQRALAPLLPPALDARQAELLDALAAVFGSAPFTAAEVLQVARTPMGDRRRLQAALQALGGSALDAHKLGMRLGVIVARTVGRHPRLVRAGGEGGSGVWAVEGATGA